jgi:hypothetical protein
MHFFYTLFRFLNFIWTLFTLHLYTFYTSFIHFLHIIYPLFTLFKLLLHYMFVILSFSFTLLYTLLYSHLHPLHSHDTPITILHFFCKCCVCSFDTLICIHFLYTLVHFFDREWNSRSLISLNWGFFWTKLKILPDLPTYWSLTLLYSFTLLYTLLHSHFTPITLFLYTFLNFHYTGMPFSYTFLLTSFTTFMHFFYTFYTFMVLHFIYTLFTLHLSSFYTL